MKEGKNNLVKLTVITLLITMIGIIFMSGTYSKYTSSATGSDSARVAKWSFKVGTGDSQVDIATTDTFTINLFSTITNTSGTTETAVSATDGSLIAPGTMGSFYIDVENASEVTASYTVGYELINASNIPLEFTTDVNDDGTVKTDATWTDEITDVNQNDTTLAIGETGTTAKVYWRWAFDGDDVADTTLGVAATTALEADSTGETAPKAEIKATITAKQVN